MAKTDPPKAPKFNPDEAIKLLKPIKDVMVSIRCFHEMIMATLQKLVYTTIAIQKVTLYRSDMIDNKSLHISEVIKGRSPDFRYI